MSRAMLTEILKINNPNNYHFLSMQVNNIGNPGLLLLGKPVELFEDMPEPASGSLSIAYGDMRKAYTVLDRSGIEVLRDPYTSKGNVIYYTTKRVGGSVVNHEALKIGKLSV